MYFYVILSLEMIKMRLKDKVAIITGSTSGIGLAIAKEYLKEGAYVTICGTNQDKLNKALLELEKEYASNHFLGVICNVANTIEVENLFKEVINKFHKLDILINNAGIAPAKSIQEMTDDDFNNVININTGGTFRCTREALKYMNNGGSIINTSSFVSLYGSVNQSGYTASKSAINGLTKACAKELGKDNIRVNAVAPGVVMTEMVKDNCNEETINRLNMMTPLKRGATTQDLVGIYVYLGSDESKFTTGTIINIDGGLVM